MACDRLKSYQGDAAQWKDWRFNISTWLAQVKTSFETLTTKLDNKRCQCQKSQKIACI